MSGYRRRGLETLWRDAFLHQVVLIEGRRAIGKTRLAKHLRAQGLYASFSTLADPLTRAQALQDPDGWVRSLPRPAVIDEAQLASGLPLAIKELVDELGPGHHFLLTGSASIGRGTLGGADPLSGRLLRRRLEPFTGFELNSEVETASLVDLLFEGNTGYHEVPPTARDDMVTVLRRGGMPLYALAGASPSDEALAQLVTADVLAVLGDQLLPEDSFDALRARGVLDALLRIPGGLLNYSRVGDDLSIDRRTVERYLGILERRFLVDLLHNFRAGPSGASRARPKIHATDSSLSSDALGRAGWDIATHPEQFGQVLETWVYQQVVGNAGWSALQPRIGYWRDNRTSTEVDLVLADGRGRTVGVEVKASSRLTQTDAKGLLALKSQSGLHRGYVVYLGTELRQITDSVWGLPVSMLREPETWH